MPGVARFESIVRRLRSGVTTPPPATAGADRAHDEQRSQPSSSSHDHPRTGASVSSRVARAGHDWSRSTCHVYLQTPRWSAKQEHVLRDRPCEKEQRGPAIETRAPRHSTMRQQLVEVWDQHAQADL